MMQRPHVEADDDGHDDSSSSSDESSSSSDSEHAPINCAQHYTDGDDDVSLEQRQVKNWSLRIPIGLGLCPWASKSHNQGNLRYVTATSETPRDVAVCVQHEIQRLVCNDSEPPPWSTTLVICPHIREWNDSFPAFDRFVSHDIWDQFEQDDKDESNTSTISDDITLVAFHPNFLRWHGLPDKIEKGSVVQSHYGIIGKKSVETAPATIVETCNKAFGMRKVKVRFHDACNARRQEQYVPTDWISIHPKNIGEVDTSDPSKRGPALPDNAMHQAPHPTIHIINNADLARLSIRDSSRVKRKNAHRMMKLGWDGIEKKLSLGSINTA